MKSAESQVTTIRVRNVPDSIYRKLKARATAAGMSLSDYLLDQLTRIVEKPTREELLARIAAREPVHTQERAADLVRAERDRR